MSHTAETWDLPSRFSALLKLPLPTPMEVREAVPDFSFTHVPLAEMAFDQIPGTPSGILVLRALKASRHGSLLDEAVLDEALIRRVPLEIFLRVLRYIMAADIDTRGFLMKISSIKDAETRSATMTLAQRFRQEGRQEGLRAGRRSALLEAVLCVLVTRFCRLPQGVCSELAGVQGESRLHALIKTATECGSL